ncbi:hypothetical protein [Microtetraspora niveoalba]|uniref:hypothetical protein n=1 Tax=Microtetraspora niveoalba TaxID=46175 RepID=UPI000836ED82|nr:hypothetical protein [Microtetraspora niveoalba]
MDNHHEDPLDALGHALLGAYVLIGKLLGWLPLPIGLPPIDEEDWDGLVAVAAIDRARIAVRDLPLDSLTASIMDKLLLEWLTAHDLGVITEVVGRDRWRLEALSYALSRITSLAQLAESRLRPYED